MAEQKPAMNMPELLVFFRAIGVGFLGAEIFQIMFYLGESFARNLSNSYQGSRILIIAISLTISLIYSINRGIYFAALRLIRSLRFDLLAALVVGAYCNQLAETLLEKVNVTFEKADPLWAPTILSLLCILLLSPLIEFFWPKSKNIPQLYFLADEEIEKTDEDLLGCEAQAKSFAETVLASGAHSGLVYGVDGPWGVGKTSFINLAERHWRNATESAIVCRFEPLRYASAPDLSELLIRDLSAAIQRQVFVPEFRPTASRYSRLLKGKADLSFFGFKLSLEPSGETIDDLLDDIDNVLKRIQKRVIIVVDDLDRLDPKIVNNVLFATRRTFRLSQATYILCYDTDVLLRGKNDEGKAREFLEKFVTVKLSLFIDSKDLQKFLRTDWRHEKNNLGSIPSDTVIKLGSILSELADILDDKESVQYLPLIGDLRKLKRFVNAMLFMQIDKTDLGRTDFHLRDLINLMLLHLNYPALFRQIYAEETEDRSGSFSLKRDFGNSTFINSERFSELLSNYTETEQFLLRNLFDNELLKNQWGAFGLDDAVLNTRACFNQAGFRNLEKYLKLIVRFAVPEPKDTYVLYRSAVNNVKRGGTSIEFVLKSPDFHLRSGEHSHDQFWSILVSQSDDFTKGVAEDAIQTLVNYLPRYSSVSANDRGLRQRSIYTLILLLDRAGWGRTDGRRHPNRAEYVVEIAWRIFGERMHAKRGLIELLSSHDRGALGWYDLMLFRLQCSADRGGQVYNVSSALIVHEDIEAKTDGMISVLARNGMRRLSQAVFARFKEIYIDKRRNFLSDVDDISLNDLLGEAYSEAVQKISNEANSDSSSLPLLQSIEAARFGIKSFVLYQLSDRSQPTGSGVGCGLYDESGDGDDGGISKLMNKYVFDTCFNPERNNDNIFFFLDHCLLHLSSGFFSEHDEEGYVATKKGLPGSFDPVAMGVFWKRHRSFFMKKEPTTIDRRVITINYIASYRDDLEKVFNVLNELADEVPAD